MEKLNFNDCTLYISARSPFARRVKLALLENKITFEQKILNVFEPQPELTSLNPLSRVPVVKLKDGQVLIDSNLILQEFYLSHGKFPSAPRDFTTRGLQSMDGDR